MISIVIPTIEGRERWLAKAVAGFNTHKPVSHQYELIIIDGMPTCGAAWNKGLERAKGDFILLSADDIEPTHGWAEWGTHWILMHQSIPCPRVLNTDGSLQSCGPDANEHETGTPSDVARVPFFPATLTEHIYPIIDQHYMTDYWVTKQAEKVGWPTKVVREFCFTHHMAKEGRLNSLPEDIDSFYAATR